MSATCPTCGRDDFASETGMKIHHAQSHGESISGVETKCTTCGESLRVSRQRLEDRDRIFCSYDCQGEWRSENFTGENNSAWKGGPVETECAACGGSIEVIQARYDKYEKHFCDAACAGQWTSENQRGEDHPNYKEKVTVECTTCGEEMVRYPSHVYETGRAFCSQKCRGEWISENFSGEGNPGYIDGKAGQRPYNALFTRQRAKALIRDEFQCTRCGMSRTEHEEKHGLDIHVHHITPLREFDDPERAHQLDNLRTLCMDCHFEVEK